MEKKRLFSLLLVPSLLTSCGENKTTEIDVFETPIYATVVCDFGGGNDKLGEKLDWSWGRTSRIEYEKDWLPMKTKATSKGFKNTKTEEEHGVICTKCGNFIDKDRWELYGSDICDGEHGEGYGKYADCLITGYFWEDSEGDFFWIKYVTGHYNGPDDLLIKE